MRDSEIIVDNFAGGGGASTGIEMATGRSVDIAINHDPNAIAMHTTNHPNTLHYCESVYTVRPKVATAGRRVALVWSSPDCRHFSKAKGAKPVEKAIRGLAWVTLRWGLDVDPKSQAVLTGELAPWRTAAECIDWSIPATSIFDRKKSLAVNTLKRIARGIQRFVIDSPSPFIVKCNHTTTKGKYDCFRGQALDEPLQTITKTHGYAVAVPHLTKFRTGATGQPVTEPVPTVTAGTSKRPGGNGHALGVVEAALAPFLAGNGGSEYQAKPRPLDKPAHTILKESRACVVAPVIARQFGASIGHRADEPSATITAGGGGKSQLVTPTLIQMGYGERPGQEPRVLQLDNPLGTVTAGGNKFATVSAFLAKHYGGNYTGPGVSLDEPAHSVTTVDHHAVVASHLVKLRGTCRDGQRTNEPMPTVTAGGQHVGEVKATLAASGYDEHRAQQTLAFLREYCGEDCDGLVTVEGITYRIVDIGMRMLQPHELYRAQGFPDWYIIDQDYSGKKYAKDKQVARCGNAVPPPFAEALVRANLPELCNQKGIAA